MVVSRGRKTATEVLVSGEVRLGRARCSMAIITARIYNVTISRGGIS